MPVVNTEAMNEHLKEISTQIAPGAYAVLVCDGAGWHQPGGRLRVPGNITCCRCHPTRRNSTRWRMLAVPAGNAHVYGVLGRKEEAAKILKDLEARYNETRPSLPILP